MSRVGSKVLHTYLPKVSGTWAAASRLGECERLGLVQEQPIPLHPSQPTPPLRPSFPLPFPPPNSSSICHTPQNTNNPPPLLPIPIPLTRSPNTNCCFPLHSPSTLRSSFPPNLKILPLTNSDSTAVGRLTRATQSRLPNWLRSPPRAPLLAIRAGEVAAEGRGWRRRGGRRRRRRNAELSWCGMQLCWLRGEHGTQVRAARDAISVIRERSVWVRVCVRLRRAGGGGHARESNFVVVWEAQRREEIAREKGEGGVLTPLKLRSSSSPVADLSITGVDYSSRQWSHLPRS